MRCARVNVIINVGRWLSTERVGNLSRSIKSRGLKIHRWIVIEWRDNYWWASACVFLYGGASLCVL